MLQIVVGWRRQAEGTAWTKQELPATKPQWWFLNFRSRRSNIQEFSCQNLAKFSTRSSLVWCYIDRGTHREKNLPSWEKKKTEIPTLLNEIFATRLFRDFAWGAHISRHLNSAILRKCTLNHLNFAFLSSTQFISLAMLL